jgi:hypothetical protein
MLTRFDRINPIFIVIWFCVLLFIPDLSRAAATVPGDTNTVLAKPAIPTSGAYLGAWVNPQGLAGNGGAAEIQQLPRFNAYIGKPVAILHLYLQFTDSFPNTVLAEIEQNGSIPIVDWGCADVDQINLGTYDSIITFYAQSFKNFGMPVFLRWFWEMNLDTTAHQPCNAYNRGSAYIAAWQRIWNIFNQVGAANVAFVWCPNAGGDASQYYPGDQFVDWIAGDNYDTDHLGGNAFTNSFNHFYNQWVAHHKPLMVGETAATAIDQYQYIQSIGQIVPDRYPQFRAIIYFDAPGTNGNWSLDGNGVAAFRTLAFMPYFSFHQ